MACNRKHALISHLAGKKLSINDYSFRLVEMEYGLWECEAIWTIDGGIFCPADSIETFVPIY
jgi:hypothetical protein